jgi:hypothetical protein
LLNFDWSEKALAFSIKDALHFIHDKKWA